MAGTDDLAALVADLAALVRADRAERVQRAIAVVMMTSGLPVARIGVEGAP